MNNTYANVAWTPEDVQTLRPNWELEKCIIFLKQNEHHIRDRLIEYGWDIIDSLIEMEE